MVELVDPRRLRELHDTFENLHRAIASALGDPSLRPGDIPSGEETRELLGLYAKLPSEDVRRALLELLRATVGSVA